MRGDNGLSLAEETTEFKKTTLRGKAYMPSRQCADSYNNGNTVTRTERMSNVRFYPYNKNLPYRIISAPPNVANLFIPTRSIYLHR